MHADRIVLNSDTRTSHIEDMDVNDTTALLRAACDQNWKEVKKLILAVADPSVADDQGLTTYTTQHSTETRSLLKR